MDINRLKRDIPSEVFEGWKAYRRLHPFGDDWQQAGTIAAAAMNPHCSKQRKVEDFVPAKKVPSAILRGRKLTAKEIWRKLKSALGVAGDDINRDAKR